MIKIFLERVGIKISNLTVHKYMNTELKLSAIVRRKKPHYRKGIEGKAFANLINQDFRADKKNTLWCTDFTYLPLSNGKVRYNYTIMDLYDKNVIASITDREITSDLAIRTLRKGIYRTTYRGRSAHYS